MSFFKKFFENTKKQKNVQLEKIGQELGLIFPPRFIKVISDNEEPLMLNLLDETYKVINSFYKDGEDSKFQDIKQLIEHFNSSPDSEERYMKIPFAQNLKAGKDKYLMFIGEKGKEIKEHIYMTDYNHIISKLEISPFINLFESNSISSFKGKGVKLDCLPKSIYNLIEKFELPKEVEYWKDSFGHAKREGIEDNKNDLNFDIHAVYYSFSDAEGNLCKLEVQCTFSILNTNYYTSSAYQIDNPNIEWSIEHNIDYRLFYYKLICVMHTIRLSKELLLQNEFVSKGNLQQIIEKSDLLAKISAKFRSTNFNRV